MFVKVKSRYDELKKIAEQTRRAQNVEEENRKRKKKHIPNKETLLKWTVQDLKNLMKKLDIVVDSKARKQELISTLCNY